jgi:hypothetical protein
VSCGSPGNCVAGGRYTDSASRSRAFVVDEVDGKWGNLQEVPGTSDDYGDYDASVDSVSCASSGNCVAGGKYTDSAFYDSHAFVANEIDSKWGKAEEVSGTAQLNASGSAGLDSVSCPSSGNCTAGGYYRDGANKAQTFVVSEVNGKWGQAREVPGTSRLNVGGGAEVDSISCASPGQCAAGGSYIDGAGNTQAFVSDEEQGSGRQPSRAPAYRSSRPQ